MELNLKRDGHVHSPYCPHGSLDTFDMYIERALLNGISEITFTEHMPLTLKKDPSPRNNSAMDEETLIKYLKAVKEIKDKYKDKIKIDTEVPEALAAAMGNHVFIFRTEKEEELIEMIRFILKRNGDGNWI